MNTKKTVAEVKSRDLLACPFCGEEAEIKKCVPSNYKPRTLKVGYVRCKKVKCRGRGLVSVKIEEAIKSWNERVG